MSATSIRSQDRNKEEDSKRYSTSIRNKQFSGVGILQKHAEAEQRRDFEGRRSSSKKTVGLGLDVDSVRAQIAQEQKERDERSRSQGNLSDQGDGFINDVVQTPNTVISTTTKNEEKKGLTTLYSG